MLAALAQFPHAPVACRAMCLFRASRSDRALSRTKHTKREPSQGRGANQQHHCYNHRPETAGRFGKRLRFEA